MPRYIRWPITNRNTMKNEFAYGLDQLDATTCLAIARGQIKGVLTPEAVQKVKRSAEAVEKIAAGEASVYGVNTGFGPLCNTKISSADTRKLQTNILKSHSVGVGSPVPPECSIRHRCWKKVPERTGFSATRVCISEFSATVPIYLC